MSVEKEFATKAVVVISGGCLVSVYADGPLEVTLLDRDNIEDDDEHNEDQDEFETQLENATLNMNEVW